MPAGRVERILRDEETKSAFLAHARIVNGLFKAILPDAEANRFAPIRSVLTYLADAIKSLDEDKDKEIENLKNESEQSEQKTNSLLENIKKLEAKTEEQYKTIEVLQNEAKNKEKNIKPTNLPTD